MAAVSEVVDEVARTLREPRDTVAAYARALIDAGLLPKSRGRAIAQVEPVHVIRLMLTVARLPRVKDAAEWLREYSDLRLGGIPEEWPIKSERFEDFMLLLWSIVRTDEPSDLQLKWLKAEIEIVQTWPEVAVKFGNEVARFTKPPDQGTHWHGFLKRSVILHALGFDDLYFKSGLDDHETADG